ncbi:hypothetical protein JCM10908_002255 [Rhodotorula pacifica]|uniref:uncharacterized protein n=1 Tax=Rhodotorula pacifica TaxID=1495444 RepID=UPI0031792040
MPPAPTSSSVRRLVIAGLGNASHPLTRHSIGQFLLKNLALRAASDPSYYLSGSSHFQPLRIGRHALLSTRITLRPPSTSNRRDQSELELHFVIPKAPMNINGPAVVAAFEAWIPPNERIPAHARRSPTPPPVEPLPTAPTRRQRKQPPARPKNLRSLLTLQDDLDLSPSVLKYQPGGGPRGHNGVRSVSSSLNSDKYHRLWIGIGRPEERGDVARYVLGPMGREEVRACEFVEGKGGGGEVLEKAWREVLRIGFEEVEEEVP